MNTTRAERQLQIFNIAGWQDRPRGGHHQPATAVLHHGRAGPRRVGGRDGLHAAHPHRRRRLLHHHCLCQVTPNRTHIGQIITFIIFIFNVAYFFVFYYNLASELTYCTWILILFSTCYLDCNSPK